MCSTHTNSHDPGLDRRYHLFLCIRYRYVPVVDSGAVRKYDLIDCTPCSTLVLTRLTLSEKVVCAFGASSLWHSKYTDHELPVKLITMAAHGSLSSNVTHII